MKYYFLSSKFYSDYPINLYPEIERKSDRPYVIICITLNNNTFALPLRSHINHKFAYFTDKANKCGVDFSKAIYISDDNYLNKTKKPYLRQNEFDYLKDKEYIIKKKFIRYIQAFVDAKNLMTSTK